MSAHELRARADRLKELALRSKDEDARSELLYLADEYERAAGFHEASCSYIAPTTFPH